MAVVQEDRVGLCRLCGAQEGRLLHLQDTFSMFGTTSTILQLLQSISVFLRVQSDYEPLMPNHLCWTCFKTTVDINAFINSGINFQRTTANHFIPSFGTSIKDAFCNPFLFPILSSEEGSQEIAFQGELLQKNNVVLDAPNIQTNVSILAVTEEGKLEECCSTESRISIDKGFDSNKMGQENYGGSLQHFLQSYQLTREAGEAITVIEELPEESQEFQQENSTANDGGEDKKPQHNKQMLPYCDKKEKSQERKHLLLLLNGEAAKNLGAEADSLRHRNQCPHCSKMFLRQSQLKSHLVTHSEARPHQCSVCGVAFKHRRNLVEHTHTHSQRPSFICAMCGLPFKQKSNLLKHEKTHRKGSERGYKCDTCNNCYSQSSHLKTHINNAHRDNIGFQCNQCSVVLLRRSSLRRHLATVHASTSRFTCQHCSKGFNNQQNYQGHMRTHTGERPYKCLVCSKAFTTSKALSRHRMVHQGTRAHKCEQCGKAFLELCDLKRHTKRHLLKNTKRTTANDISQESLNTSTSINLMVLTDSLIFTESRQLLGNPEPRAEKVLQSSEKPDAPKEISSEIVLESSKTPHQMNKNSHLEVLAAGPLLPSSSDMRSVLKPPVMGDMAVQLHPSQMLQPSPMEEEGAGAPPQVDLMHCECAGSSAAGAVAADTPTMTMLASASTHSEFLSEPEPRTGDATTSPVGDVGERVLSHATW